MRLKDFIAKTISQIQDGVDGALDLDCETIPIHFDVSAAIGDDDEDVYVVSPTNVAFDVPIKAYKISE